MRSKAKKQGKLMKILSAPIKILGKARDFYVKGMQDYAGQVSYGTYGGGTTLGCPSAPAVQLPKSFSGRNMESELRRSYSVNVGKIGIIDEDKSCAFEEDDLKANLLYQRSKSQVFKRNFVYQD